MALLGESLSLGGVGFKSLRARAILSLFFSLLSCTLILRVLPVPVAVPACCHPSLR